jgi:type I restriction enzyme, S subunit
MNLKPYPQYKESKAPFLMEIPIGWDEMPFYTLCREKVIENNEGKELLSVFLNMGVIKYNQSSEKQVHKPSEDLSKYQLVESGDLVLNNQQAWRGSVGVSKYLGIVSPAYYVFRVDKSMHTSFANYLVRSPLMINQFVLASKGVGSIQRNLFFPFLKRTTVPHPPFDEQTQIARYLDWKTTQINKFIKAKKKLIELLKEQKQVIINDAVTGKINVRTGKPYPKYKDSGVEWLGEIPKHWEGRKLKTFCSLISKGTTPSTEGKGFVDYGIRFIKAENISNGKLNLSPEFFIDSETDNLLKRSQLKKNDILIVIAGATIGKVAIMSKDFLPANTNQAVCFLRLFQPVYLKYIYYILQSQYLKSIINLFSVQSAQPNLAMGVLRNFVLPTPNNEEIAEIVSYIERNEILIEDSILKVKSEITLFQEYRKCLIDSSVTGKIDVRHILVPEYNKEEVILDLEESSDVEEVLDDGIIDNDL